MLLGLMTLTPPPPLFSFFSGGKGDGARGYNAVILKQPEVVAKVTHQNPQKQRHSYFPVWLFVLR